MFVIVVTITTLFVASPAVQSFLFFPQTDFFTEFWILGSDQTTKTFPSTITSNHNYRLFLGIGNDLGSCGYYMIQMKFYAPSLEDFSIYECNSSSRFLYVMNVFVADKQTVLLPIDFSFDYTVTDSTIDFNHLLLNEDVVDLRGYSIAWNHPGQNFYGKLVFELYLYNSTLDCFEYHERYVDLGLNLAV